MLHEHGVGFQGCQVISNCKGNGLQLQQLQQHETSCTNELKVKGCSSAYVGLEDFLTTNKNSVLTFPMVYSGRLLQLLPAGLHHQPQVLPQCCGVP